MLLDMDTAERGRKPATGYQRPYAVAESLELLHGPSSGKVRLPTYLDWSGHAEYDLDSPGRVSAAKVSSRDPAVLTEFGHLVETFAVEKIWIPQSSQPVRLR